MRRIAIFVIILLAVFTFINVYSIDQSGGQFQEARFSAAEADS